MRILFAAQSVPEDPSVMHRIHWPAEELRERDHDVTIIHGVKRRIAGRSLRVISPRALSEVLRREYDVVILSRDASPLARTLQICSDFRESAFVFDFDDAIYNRMNISGTRIPNPVRVCLGSILSNADCVTTGTNRMTAFASDYTSSAQTITTPTNTDLFKPGDSPREYDQPVIGWMGSGPGHISNLTKLVEPLIKLAEDGFDFRFRVVSALNDEVKDLFAPLEEYIPVDYGFDSWQPIHRIVEEMRTFDVGVCPLSLDDPYMEGKSPMKVLEMMATGLPVVASAVGTYSDVVKDGQTGLLVDSKDDWANALKALLGQSKYRIELATAGREYVLRNHTVDVYTGELELILRGIVK